LGANAGAGEHTGCLGDHGSGCGARRSEHVPVVSPLPASGGQRMKSSMPGPEIDCDIEPPQAAYIGTPVPRNRLTQFTPHPTSPTAVFSAPSCSARTYRPGHVGLDEPADFMADAVEEVLVEVSVGTPILESIVVIWRTSLRDIRPRRVACSRGC